MIVDESVKSEGKCTRTIQYPDEQIEETRDGPVSGVDVLLCLHASRLWTSADDDSRQ
jgi:hypothetical protein